MSQIYFIADGAAIKIGRSATVGERFRSIETGNPNDLELIACIDGGAGHEKAIHRELKDFRLRGEWFADCSPVREAIARYQKDGAPLSSPVKVKREVADVDAREYANLILEHLDNPDRLERAEAKLAAAKADTAVSLDALRALVAAYPENRVLKLAATKYLLSDVG